MTIEFRKQRTQFSTGFKLHVCSYTTSKTPNLYFYAQVWDLLFSLGLRRPHV